MMDNMTTTRIIITGEKEICLQVPVVKSARKRVVPLKFFRA